MAALYLDARLVKTPGGYRTLIYREGWNKGEALKKAIIRVDTLERLLCKYVVQQSEFLAKIEAAEHRAELAEYRESIAHERTGNRDEKIGMLEAQLEALGVPNAAFAA